MPPKKLLDQCSEMARLKHFSIRTVQELLGHKNVSTPMY